MIVYSVPVPVELAKLFYAGSEALKWPVKEYLVGGKRPCFEIYPQNRLHPDYDELTNFMFEEYTGKIGKVTGTAQRVLFGYGKGYESNGWHTDTVPGMVAIAVLPFDTQKPLVAEVDGKYVQGAIGSVTFIDAFNVRHRASATPGDRILCRLHWV